MLVSYNGLFKQLIDKGWNKTEFAREVGGSTVHSAISCRSSRTSRRQGTVSSVR